MKNNNHWQNVDLTSLARQAMRDRGLEPDFTPEALQPIYDSILNAVKRHYDYGLRLFLENGGRGLKIPISSERLLALARGDGGR